MATASALIVYLGASAGASAESKPPVPKENLVLVASVINTTNPYMISNIAGAEALSKKLGIPLEVVNSTPSNRQAARVRTHKRVGALIGL